MKGKLGGGGNVGHWSRIGAGVGKREVCQQPVNHASPPRHSLLLFSSGVFTCLLNSHSRLHLPIFFLLFSILSTLARRGSSLRSCTRGGAKQIPHSKFCKFLANRVEDLKSLNPSGRGTKSDKMGFKSSVAIAQTTRFKRKLPCYNRNNTFTPPAAPFNNTSFLIQLQQRREQGSTPRSLRFDQYGSMESMIACYSFATTTSPAQNHPQHPNSGMSTSQSSKLSLSQNTDSSHGQLNSSDADGSQICDSPHPEPSQQFHSPSDDASSGIRLKLAADPEIREGEDGVLRHCQHYMDDNFDIHADSGSSTSITKK